MESIQPEVQGQLERPFIVITPHSSTYVPPDLEGRLAVDQDEVRRFTDMHTDELYGEAVNLGGVLIPAPVSRFVVQLNRWTKTEDGKLHVWDKKLKPLADANPRNPDSSFIRYSWTGSQVMQPELTEEEMIEIYGQIYGPFFDAIDKAVAEAQAKFGYSILIDGHSFNSVSVKGEERKMDFVLGTRGGKTADAALVNLVAISFLGRGKNSAVNLYGLNGGYPTGHYSRLASAKEMRPKGINPAIAQAVQIEANKAQYMDERTFEKTSDFGRTQSDISYCLEYVSKFRPRK
jgi:N-formylglutamate amidohydrolase